MKRLNAPANVVGILAEASFIDGVAGAYIQ